MKNELRLFIESGDFDPDRLNYTQCPECDLPNKLMVGTIAGGGIFYRCLHVDCGVTGVLRKGIRVTSAKRQSERETEPKITQSPLGPIQAEALWQYVPGLQSWSTAHLRRRISLSENSAYVYPILGPHGEHRGDLERYYDGRKKKAIVHCYAAFGPMLHWERFGVQTVVLVEDVPSAMSLAMTVAGIKDQYLSVVALHGTHLSTEGASEIRQFKPRRVIWALDRDAYAKSLALRKKTFFGYNCTTAAVRLDRDLKDMTPEQLQAWWTKCTQTE